MPKGRTKSNNSAMNPEIKTMYKMYFWGKDLNIPFTEYMKIWGTKSGIVNIKKAYNNFKKYFI